MLAHAMYIHPGAVVAVVLVLMAIALSLLVGAVWLVVRLCEYRSASARRRNQPDRRRRRPRRSRRVLVVDESPGSILFLESSAKPPSAGTCPVCAEPIGSAPVSCARCGSPHHADCWDYVRTCAIFGCESGRARAG